MSRNLSPDEQVRYNRNDPPLFPDLCKNAHEAGGEESELFNTNTNFKFTVTSPITLTRMESYNSLRNLNPNNSSLTNYNPNTNFELINLTYNRHYIGNIIDLNGPLFSQTLQPKFSLNSSAGKPKEVVDYFDVAKTFLQPIKTSDFESYLDKVRLPLHSYKNQQNYFLGDNKFNGEVTNIENKQGEQQQEEGYVNQFNSSFHHFFDPTFQLESNLTFTNLCQLAKLDSEPSSLVESDLELVTSQKLLDKLASLMDKVETKLVTEVDLRSQQFFQALNLLQKLESEVDKSCNKVEQLKEKMNKINNSQARNGLQIVQLRQRREKLTSTLTTVNTLSRLNLVKSTVDQLISVEFNDPIKATQLLDEIQPEIQVLSPKLISLKSFKVSLHKSASRAIELLQHEFVSLTVDLFSSSSSDDYNVAERLKVVVLKLKDKDSLKTAYQLAKVRLEDKIYSKFVEAIKNWMAFLNPDQLNFTFPDKDVNRWPRSKFAKSVLQLQFDQYLELIESNLQHTETTLVKLRKLQLVLDSIDSPTNQNEKPFSPTVPLIHQPCTTCHLRNYQLLVLRMDSTAFETNQLVQVDKLVKNYLQRISSLQPVVEPDTLLERTLNQLASQALDRIHNEIIGKIQQSVDKDTWAPMPIPDQLQDRVEKLFSNVKYLAKDNLHFEAGNSLQETETKAKPAEKLDILNVTYHLPQSGQLLLFTLLDYLDLAYLLPNLTVELVAKVIDLIQHFHYRTANAILGAQAITTAQLPRISARHIALLSQTLQVVLTAVPQLKLRLEDLLDKKTKSLVKQIDLLKVNLVDHQNQLHTKLVNILSDRAQLLFQSWDGNRANSNSTTDAVSEEEEEVGLPFKKLVEDSNNLTRILTKFLTPGQLQHILESVYLKYCATIQIYLEKVEVKTIGKKKRMLNEVKYLNLELRKLGVNLQNMSNLEVQINEIRL